MAIRLWDSMNRAKVPLTLREDGKVSMYACGPTVYNFIHIGNARTFVWFDFLARYLRYRGYEVEYVANHTDVDDKIIERANLEGTTTDAITEKYIRAYEEDMAALGATVPDRVVRATEHIDDMIEAISGLIEKDVAYEAGGNVWFSVEALPSYGKLSHRSVDDMRAGERVEPHPDKRFPLDFSLWKAAKEGEPSWPSPWGPGRPGWHIECSVMSVRYLGMGFDIHGGGSDLIFPHHENEIAQAEALAGDEPFARHWLHAGMVQMDAQKMSKSLGNIALAHDLINEYGGAPARYWCLMGSLRSQATFSDASLRDAQQGLERWQTFHDAAVHALGRPAEKQERTTPVGEEASRPDAIQRFVAELDDDLNSAGAFAVVHEIVREGNRQLGSAQRGDAAARSAVEQQFDMFVELTGVLGFKFEATREAGHEIVGGLLDLLVEMREQAREERAFDRADAIRDRLTELGVAIEDTPAGPRWRLPS